MRHRGDHLVDRHCVGNNCDDHRGDGGVVLRNDRRADHHGVRHDGHYPNEHRSNGRRPNECQPDVTHSIAGCQNAPLHHGTHPSAVHPSEELQHVQIPNETRVTPRIHLDGDLGKIPQIGGDVANRP